MSRFTRAASCLVIVTAVTLVAPPVAIASGTSGADGAEPTSTTSVSQGEITAVDESQNGAPVATSDPSATPASTPDGTPATPTTDPSDAPDAPAAPTPPTDEPTPPAAPAPEPTEAPSEPSEPAPSEPTDPSTPAPAPSAPAEPSVPAEPALPAEPTADPTEPAADPTAPADPGEETRYVVQYEAGTDVTEETDVLEAAGTEVEETFDAVLPVAVVSMTPDEADELVQDSAVVAVEEDIVIDGFAAPRAPWNLDRVNQRSLPLNGSYRAPSSGAGVTVYVVDSGVAGWHQDFGGRVARGWTAFDDGRGTGDCQGHGTHVAGTVAGSTYGVAKGVTVVPVRVLGCDGKGSLAGIVHGLDWIVRHHKSGTPAVANLSLGGSSSTILDAYLNAVIDDGVTAVVAAGNASIDACQVSPARVPRALTVAASDLSDQHAGFSNSGSCVDVYAPGVDILSASPASPGARAKMSGTSASAPHVAGAAALVLAQNPRYTPAQVAAAVRGNATPGAIRGSTRGTVNRMLFVPNPGDPASVNPTGTIDRVSTTTGTITLAGWARDPDSTSPVNVHVYVDGRAVRAVRAEGSRPDVQRSAPGIAGPKHGYSVTVPASDGRHTVCVYGINVGPGSSARLACKDVVVRNRAPLGSVDAVAASGTDAITVRGWALDPDTSSSVDVHVYVDGKAVRALGASGHRPDVGRAYRLGDAHGYSARIPVAAGRHRVCVYGINATRGRNSQIGCRTVTVRNAAPIGTIDSVSISDRTVTLRGWTLDPDTTDPISTHVYVDGRAVRAVRADQHRPDVGRVFRKGDDHGFTASFDVTPGRHTVCVYGINATRGSNPRLGCRTVLVR